MFEWSRMEKEKEQIRLIREKYQQAERPGVSIVLPTSKPKYLENIFENLRRIQYPKVEYIVIINNSRVNPQVYHERFQDLKGIRFLALDEGYTLGDCLNYGVDLAKYDYIGKMDDDDYYGACFLEDLMLAFQYTYAQIVGKGVHFVFFESNRALGVRLPVAIPYSTAEGAFYENRYTRGPSLAGGTFIVKREVFNKVRFQSVNLGEDIKFLQDCTKKDISIYGADRYNYVYRRHGDRMDHTWNVNSIFVQRQSHIIDQSGDFVPIITV
ncbi:glycosyl transferase [Desulfitobacterium dichloroeliminans LMG P-21439]|uniref:Glycosyl transferase n=2 Tax=Desulfitobacterium dichloroeliminans TaxID=233055 RepID=L0F7U1_DESDL|nr:glycosyl transferase [Desulfitobacterium dichloroeliminans LMG P-21439]